MKKLFTLTILCTFLAFGLSAQLNMSLRSQISYDQDCNDIWGYAAPDGTEYAIVGLRNGVSVVSLEDPDNATEVYRVPGQGSTWRDIKTYGEFAYVTTDQNGTTEGVTVLDLRNLPDTVSYYHYTPEILGGTLETCHNIYIDEFGYAYLAGCNLNNGGMIIFDVTDPEGDPVYVGPAPATYAHDVYVRDNKMYASEIFGGELAIYDVTDKEDIVFLGATSTPRNFTHNAWLSDDSQTIFTTDERADAPVAAYDISDPTDIIELDQFRPVATLGEGVIPHNTHTWQDWLIISYYVDGCIVVDGSRPSNLIEVGNFDTFITNGGGFSGAWGAYPFLPSELVLVSDIDNGLYVLEPNYVRACWLEGKATDKVTTLPVANVEVTIDAAQANLANTDLEGNYETGLATAGTYTVNFRAVGYEPLSVEVTLDNGVLEILNVELQPLQQVTISGIARDALTSLGIDGARIELVGEEATFALNTENDGNFTLSNIWEDTYDIYVGAWGYRQQVAEAVSIEGGTVLEYDLLPGYEDDFVIDLGWTATTLGDVTAGEWERGVPEAAGFGGFLTNPGEDIPGDLGASAYVTGLAAGGGAGANDIDGGEVILRSQPINLAGATTAELSYYLWFTNVGGNGAPNDEVSVTIGSPSETVTLEVVNESIDQWRDQSVFQLQDFITLTDNMYLEVRSGDLGEGHLVEAGFDVFRIETDLFPNSTGEAFVEAGLEVFPNPSADVFQLQYNLDKDYVQAQLEVVNVLGQAMLSQRIDSQQGIVEFGQSLAPGTYFVSLNLDGEVTRSVRVVKID